LQHCCKCDIVESWALDWAERNKVCWDSAFTFWEVSTFLHLPHWLSSHGNFSCFNFFSVLSNPSENIAHCQVRRLTTMFARQSPGVQYTVFLAPLWTYCKMLLPFIPLYLRNKTQYTTFFSISSKASDMILFFLRKIWWTIIMLKMLGIHHCSVKNEKKWFKLSVLDTNRPILSSSQSKLAVGNSTLLRKCYSQSRCCVPPQHYNTAKNIAILIARVLWEFAMGIHSQICKEMFLAIGFKCS
jgi:hypothetical protein